MLFVSSCYNHIERGDEYFAKATEAINNDSIIQAYSFIEKAIDEYQQGKDQARENKAKIFLSLLYFSTGQKDKAYDIIKDMKSASFADENYPLYSNYFRIKAFYKSVYENDTRQAVALMDSVLLFDKMYVSEDTGIINIDRLNKCEILLNGGDTSLVDALIDSVLVSTVFPSPMEPQIYANMARRYDLSLQHDSAYKYANMVVEKTSKMHEDIDNNIFALDIIIRYDSTHHNLPHYIQARNMMETLKDERHGEGVKYGMAFAKEKNLSETLRLKTNEQIKTWIFIAVFILLVACIAVLFLTYRQKVAVTKQRLTQLECDRLDAEAFKRKLENELLQRKINAKSDELKKANNEILELSQQLAQKSSAFSNSDAPYMQRLLDKLKRSYPDFQARINAQYPDITKTESTLASLIKLNLTSEEITTAMSISKAGLIKARYRLRKRLGIESSAELDNFIVHF